MLFNSILRIFTWKTAKSHDFNGRWMAMREKSRR
jgi:hypothetical protein